MKATPTVKSILDIEDARRASLCFIPAYVELRASDVLKSLLVALPEESAHQVLDAMRETFLMGVLYATGEPYIIEAPAPFAKSASRTKKSRGT